MNLPPPVVDPAMGRAPLLNQVLEVLGMAVGAQQGALEFLNTHMNHVMEELD